MKRHRLERVNEFTGLIHRFNLLLKPPRRAHGTELAGGVYEDWDGVCVCGCNSTNATNKAAVVHVLTTGTDSNNAIGRSHEGARSNAQGHVAATGGVQERLSSVGRVEVAGGVV